MVRAGDLRTTVGGVDTPIYRPAARVVCVDAGNRILPMHWADPFDGARLWEPPGRGIEPGETPYQAARRELVEETGLDSAAVGEAYVDVHRDLRWNGRHMVGPEQFFLARFDGHEPAVARTGLLPDEQVNMRGSAWVAWSELDSLSDPLEPPDLLAVLAALLPEGPWRGPG